MEIEKNIPIPADSRGHSRKYPFDKMEINDSILIPFENGKSKIKIRNSVSSCLGYFRKEHPDLKFTLRTINEGVRIWRTK
ncbi:MAG: hypothetical protein ACR2NW_09290 [Thermodesulfobacteriota bacterium]